MKHGIKNNMFLWFFSYYPDLRVNLIMALQCSAKTATEVCLKVSARQDLFFMENYELIILWVSIDVNLTLYFVLPHISTSPRCKTYFVRRLNTACKLINRIPGSRLLISSLSGSALRMHVESLGKPRDSTSILKALPGKLNRKNTHLEFSISYPPV